MTIFDPRFATRTPLFGGIRFLLCKTFNDLRYKIAELVSKSSMLASVSCFCNGQEREIAWIHSVLLPRFQGACLGKLPYHDFELFVQGAPKSETPKFLRVVGYYMKNICGT